MTPPAAAAPDADAPPTWLRPVPPSASAAAAAQAAAEIADTTPMAASGQSRKLAEAGEKWTPDEDRQAEVGRYPKRSAQEAAAAGPAGPGSSNEAASGSSGVRSSSAAGSGLQPQLDAAAHAAMSPATTSAAAATVPGIGRSVKSMEYAFRNALAKPATAGRLQLELDKLEGLGHIKCWKGKSNNQEKRTEQNGSTRYMWKAFVAVGSRSIAAAKRVIEGELNKDRQCSALAGLDYIPYPLRKDEEFVFNAIYGDRLRQPDGLVLVQVKTMFVVEESPARNPIKQREIGSTSWVAADRLVLKSHRRVARDAALLAVIRVALDHQRELVSCGEQMEIFSMEEETAGVHDSSASVLARIVNLEKQIKGRS